jgi:hypothetical protein
MFHPKSVVAILLVAVGLSSGGGYLLGKRRCDQFHRQMKVEELIRDNTPSESAASARELVGVYRGWCSDTWDEFWVLSLKSEGTGLVQRLHYVSPSVVVTNSHQLSWHLKEDMLHLDADFSTGLIIVKDVYVRPTVTGYEACGMKVFRTFTDARRIAFLLQREPSRLTQAILSDEDIENTKP